MSPEASEFSFVATHTVQDNDAYCLTLNEYRRGDDQFIMTHFSVKHFSLSTLKRMKREWSVLRECVSAPLYAVCNDGDEDKWVHFVSAFGFKPTGKNISCNNGATRRLFISQR